jgi:serpin B
MLTTSFPKGNRRGKKEIFTHFYRKSWVEDDVRSVASRNDKFSLKLYDLLKNTEGDLLMSPFSVSAVMAMVSAGARGNTLTQIMKGFSFPNSSSLHLGYQDTLPALKSTDNFTLEAANTAYSYSVLPSFQDILEKFFHTSFQTVNFRNGHSAAKKINNWVREVTRKQIKDLIMLDMLDSSTRLVLVNAIYFKGDWADKFDPKLTTDKDIYISPSTTVLVPMMMQVRYFQWANLDTLSSRMVELPYKGGKASEPEHSGYA